MAKFMSLISPANAFKNSSAAKTDSFLELHEPYTYYKKRNPNRSFDSMSYSKLMVNAPEVIRADPTAKRFEIGDLLFAQFHCPPSQDPVGIWTQTDYLLHVLNATISWKTHNGKLTAEAGDTVFFKKGVHILPAHIETDLCIEMFFIPDAFIRETIMDLAHDLPARSEQIDTTELTIRVNNDVALSAFFHAMTIYFASEQKPPEALLKLKVKELLAGILLGQSNPSLSAYFLSIVSSDAPSISAIMEMNFCHNLPIESFAEMCHRSLSSFKREFQKQYRISPGKWLLERRLQHSASLLETTAMSVTEIMFECGFEDLSHFSRSFKEKFGHSPTAHRESCTVINR
jgi:AraC family transcriptional regulator, exoenzyme S synthesis regulatory protein ExsA